MRREAPIKHNVPKLQSHGLCCCMSAVEEAGEPPWFTSYLTFMNGGLLKGDMLYHQV